MRPGTPDVLTFLTNCLPPPGVTPHAPTGAGNQIGVLVCDILHKLFAEDEVVVLKMNPVNAAIGPALCVGLKPLIDAGYVRFVYGGRVSSLRALVRACVRVLVGVPAVVRWALFF